MGVGIGGLGCRWSILARADVHEGSLGGSTQIGQLRKMGDRRTFELYREVFIPCQAP